MKLQDLASVRSGLVLSRKQAKEASEYRYPLINLRCIQQEGTIQLKEADIYEAKEPLKEEYLSQSGDIIVRLTAPYTAVLIDETNSDNFSIIDCCMDDGNKEAITQEIKDKISKKGIIRFISTHPDEDHLQGLKYLDEQIGIVNFYCVENSAVLSFFSRFSRRYSQLEI